MGTEKNSPAANTRADSPSAQIFSTTDDTDEHGWILQPAKINVDSETLASSALKSPPGWVSLHSRLTANFKAKCCQRFKNHPRHPGVAAVWRAAVGVATKRRRRHKRQRVRFHLPDKNRRGSAPSINLLLCLLRLFVALQIIRVHSCHPWSILRGIRSNCVSKSRFSVFPPRHVQQPH